MLYLIGLGLNHDGISKYGLATAMKCKRVYLENYTVEFPYPKQEIVDLIGKKIIEADREKVENLSLIDEAKKMDVALLVYGSPLTATTHITLINEAKHSNVKYKVVYNASIFDAVAETGLQMYKFGKVTSIPKWDAKKNFMPDSFMEVIKENQSINAHSLILVDIDLDFADALNQFKKSAEKHKVKLNKILVCSKLGARGKRIFYREIKDIKSSSRVEAPFCFIIPGKLHFAEKDMLEEFA